MSPGQMIAASAKVKVPEQVMEGFGNYHKQSKGIFFEGRCYLKTKTDHFKSHWAVLDGNEIFCFRKQSEE